MGKIIINNDSHVDDFTALAAVMKVMELGKISNDGKQHCYVSVVKVAGDKDVTVSSHLNKTSERFTVL